MYRRNFLFRQYPGNCYTAGKPFFIEVPRPGKYKITVTLKTENPLERVAVYTGSGNLSFTGSISAGIFRHIAIVSVGNSVPDGRNHICQDRMTAVTVKAKTDCLNSLSVSEISCPAIYIAGSAGGIMTAANGNTAGASNRTSQPADQPLSHGSKDSYARWEQMLSAYTGEKIAVSDHSRPGLTTESFRTEGHFAAINEYSRPGDFYFLRFDPAGQSVQDWAAGGNCRRQLARYIIECRERLAYPVLLTPTFCGNTEKSDSPSGQLWEQFLEAYREVSSLTETPVIELHKLKASFCDAYAMAGLAAQEIARVCEEYPERGYRFLAECIRTNCPAQRIF